MSTPRPTSFLALLVLATLFGCWEQMDDGQWFPQMKRQIAVQAFEDVLHNGQGQGFTPPEGTVPLGKASRPELAGMGFAEQDAIANPQAATLASLKRGEVLYQRYCTTCHGLDGGGNGPVAGPPFGSGPFGLVLPIGGPMSVATVYSDGHIYVTISNGRGRMPSYKRITPEDRWNVVNYLREMNGQGAR